MSGQEWVALGILGCFVILGTYILWKEWGSDEPFVDVIPWREGISEELWSGLRRAFPAATGVIWTLVISLALLPFRGDSASRSPVDAVYVLIGGLFLFFAVSGVTIVTIKQPQFLIPPALRETDKKGA